MGLAPEIFWSMTLVEWRAAVGGFAERRGARAAQPALERRDLDLLMQRFPDNSR